jgi:hypothetical protein
MEEDEGGCDDVADLPGAEAGQRLTLRRALKVVFIRSFRVRR